MGAGPAAARAAALARVEPIERLSELTLGLVGLGAIGRLVAERARLFGFRLIVHDPYVGIDQVAHLGVELMALDGLLARADIVSIHTFLSPATRHLLDARRLALMRPGAYLVNTARGPIVDEAALTEALCSGRLAGAALDVFEEEPLPPSSPLLGLDTVLLGPHLANYSVSGVRTLWLRAAGIALQVAFGGLPERAVVINRELFDRLAAAPHLQGIPRHG
jgi:D-3-phosphoglycerate dehydrogenase / 2-oxoglutarate reductase